MFKNVHFCSLIIYDEVKISGFINIEEMRWKRYYRRMRQNDDFQEQPGKGIYSLRSLFDMEPFPEEI